MPWTRFHSPAPALTMGWERASAVLEGQVRAAVTAWRGGEGVPDEPATHEAALAARALLAMGERDATKDLVRVMALALAGGRVARQAVPSLQRLVADFRAWTGDDAFLSRYQDGLERLMDLPEPEPQSLLQASADTAVGWGLVGNVTERLFGLVPEAAQGRLTVRPALPAEWREMELTGVRVGPTILDLRIRRARTGVVLRASRTHGPRLRLEVALPDASGAPQVYVDDEPLGASRAAFELAGEHEVRFEVT